jgi:hypothetical protein
MSQGVISPAIVDRSRTPDQLLLEQLLPTPAYKRLWFSVCNFGVVENVDREWQRGEADLLKASDYNAAI